MNEKQTNKTRIEYIDIARALAMFFVLWGHTVDSDTKAKTVLYAFHMPLFFLLSGMVMKPKADIWKNRKAFLYKKMVTIMVPYVIWGCVYSAFSFKNIVYILYGTRETLMHADSLSSLWFLPVLMVASVACEPFITLCEKCGKFKSVAVIAGMAACTGIGLIFPHYGKYGDPWGIDIALIAMAFMLLGYLLRNLFDRLNASKVGYGILLGGIFLIVFVMGVQYSSSSVGYVLMANAIYGNPVVFLLNAVSGSLAVVAIAIVISKGKHYKKMLIYIGQNSLGIFVLHKPFVELGRVVANRLGGDYNWIVFTAVIVVVSMGIVCIGVALINRMIPQVFGKRTFGE